MKLCGQMFQRTEVKCSANSGDAANRLTLADIVSKRWGMFSFCVIGEMPFTALTGEIETTLILLWR